jgi:3-hydroxyacyl-CoA dehydrogenase, NAD binding domain
VFGDLDRLAPEDAILGSNSSSCPTSQLIDAVSRPGRVANTHYYGGLPEVNVVEVMTCGKTTDEVIARLFERLLAYGLLPFHVLKESVGFGQLDIAQGIAGHAQLSTTKLYDRSQDRRSRKSRECLSRPMHARTQSKKSSVPELCPLSRFCDFTRHLGPVTVTFVPVFVTAGGATRREREKRNCLGGIGQRRQGPGYSD